MNFSEQIYNLINNMQCEWVTARQLYGILQVKSTAERVAVKEALSQLESDCRIVKDKRNNRFRKVNEKDFGRAVFQAHKNGYGFLTREDGDDLFVPASKTNGAFHRDKVLFRRLNGTKDEAEIVKVLERGMTHVVGIYDKSKNARFVVPDEQRFISDIYILPKRDLGAKNGQKVVARVMRWQDDNRLNPEGEIVEILGYPDDKNVDVMSVAASYNLSQRFPENVQARAETIPQSVSQKDMIGRRDLRNETVFTIDGEDARDLDDAVGIAINPDGTYRLGVHIADVSHYVPPNGDIDNEAFLRGTSVYLPETVFPMLPRELSNGICSLYEGVDRLTLTCSMNIDSHGKVLNFDLYPSVINSRHQMTYAVVQKILDGDGAATSQYSDIAEDLRLMENLAKILRDRRNRRGNIEFAAKEVEFVHNERGEVVDVRLAENSFSHQLIEEFMIVANECVAQYAENCGYPFVYRVHAKPNENKLDVLFALLNGLGINVRRTREMHNSVLRDALLKAEQTPYFNLVNDVLLRTMQKAKYSDVNSGHFGLASCCYCHFTSPIRRYPDLTVHRVLKTALSGKMTDKAMTYYEERCHEAAIQSSLCEKLAIEAERKADDIKKCDYASRLVGEQFDALVSGVTERGIFAELPNTVEGFVAAEQLGADLNYDAERFCLYNNFVRYSIGDRVTVRISSVNKQACRIDFDIVLPETAKKR